MITAVFISAGTRRDNSPFYEQGRLSVPYERCLWEFNQWWAEQLGESILE